MFPSVYQYSVMFRKLASYIEWDEQGNGLVNDCDYSIIWTQKSMTSITNWIISHRLDIIISHMSKYIVYMLAFKQKRISVCNLISYY